MGFFEFEKRWLLAVFAAVIPSSAHPQLNEGAADVPLGDFVDDLMRYAPAQFKWGLRACVWTIMFAPIVVLRRVSTFVGLSRGEQFALLEKLKQSDIYLIREMPLLFKTVACLGYGGVPRIQQQVGIHLTDEVNPSWMREGS